jgi:multidrug efflux system membrane fusion protein
MARNVLLIALMIAGSAVMVGCERRSREVAGKETPTIPVAKPEKAKVTENFEYTGRTNAKNYITIVPRVTGYLEKIPFKEGDDVKKDQLLFEIDPRPYEAQLKAAKAAVDTNAAGLRYAEATNLRFKELAKKQPGAVSERELDQYKALEEQAKANLDLANANLVSAQLNLEWTKVKSPIDGRISRYFLTQYNLVNQDQTQLTTVVSMDPMYVYFDMDEPTLLTVKRAINEKRISSPEKGDAWFFVGLAGEDGYPRKGTINFLDNQVNPGTGSIQLRGEIANPKPEKGTYVLVPGMFVRVRMPFGQPKEELLVIDRAVTSEQGQKYVYVLGKDNMVESKRVDLGPLQDNGQRVIMEGLDENDWVVVGGLQQVRPRMEIKPERLKTMPKLGAVLEFEKSGKAK